MKLILTVLLAVGALFATAGTALGWQVMSLSVECSANQQNLIWKVQAPQTESDLNIEFADNAAFVGFQTYTLDGTLLNKFVTTPLTEINVWVRWAGDHSVVTSATAGVNCQPEVVNPKGSIGGPCADPSYYGIFDNSQTTTQAITFRFRWFSAGHYRAKIKVVPAGAIFRTWEHWSKPGTLVRVDHKDPTTNLWVQDASLTATRGRYPDCEYKHGWDYPNV